LAAIEILTVSSAPAAPDRLLGSCIDLPQPGTEADVYLFQVVGWALGRSSPVIGVEIVDRGSVVQAVPANEARPDVARVHPGVPEAKTCGFRAVVNVLGLSAGFELLLTAVLEDGGRVPLGSIGGRHEPLRSNIESRLQPIVLSCLPRAGSTWLMGMLAAHPRIVVLRQYPYESSTARYWMHMLKVLLEPASITQAARDTSALAWDASYNPFLDQPIADHPQLGEWLGRGQIERLASFCVSSIDDWYRAVALAQGQDQPAYFAEKHMWPGQIPVLMSELYPDMKEVFLVRDFRDMVSSMLAFDEKRNYAGFRRPAGKSDEQYVTEDLAGAVAELHESWRARGSGSHLVRYEDMALQPRESLAALLEYLDLEASPETVSELLGKSSEEEEELRGHRTSVDLQASLGRWRDDQDPSLQRLCNEVFGSPLEAFGYTTG
jgi:hypothetical protein